MKSESNLNRKTKYQQGAEQSFNIETETVDSTIKLMFCEWRGFGSRARSYIKGQED